VSYRGRQIQIIRGADDCSAFYDALIDGVPTVAYAISHEQAVMIARLIVDATI
jgi:hypothetical protein